VQALQGLGAPADSQVISTTHSPLVLASLEGLWEDNHDRLFRLDFMSLKDGAPHVELTQEEWPTPIPQTRVPPTSHGMT
jgi:hypothetical protein